MSDIDGNNRLLDFVKCEPEFIPTEPQNGRLRARRAKQNVKKIEKPEKNKEIKGCKIDAENRYHCLECGKIFKQKTLFNQHQRLLVNFKSFM